MGYVAPKTGQVKRLVVKFRGPISQEKYDRYTNEITKLARKRGATVTRRGKKKPK
jgi:hypothetical protein